MTLSGTITKQAENKATDVHMVTPDKDYGQLVSDHIFVQTFALGKWHRNS